MSPNKTDCAVRLLKLDHEGGQLYIDVSDIPKEPEASKPKILLNLMKDSNILRNDIYRVLLFKLKDHNYLNAN